MGFPDNLPLVNSYCLQRAVDPTLPIAQVPSVVALSSVECRNGFKTVDFNLDFAATKSPISSLAGAANAPL